MDDATQDLMHRAIDGEATDAEKERLQAILATDPAAQAEWDEINRLCQILDHVKAVDPPEAWKQELLGRLPTLTARSHVTPAPPGAAAWLHRLAAALRPRTPPSRALVFVAGALAGVALFAAFGPWRQSLNGVDVRSSPGTLLRPGSIQAGRLVGEAQLDVGGARVHASARSDGRLARLEVEVRSANETGIEVDFDPTLLHLRAFDHETPRSAGIEVAAGRVEIQHQGRGRYWLWFEGTPEGVLEVRIRVRNADRTHERSLPVLRDST